ncbi:MAG: metallophosphoesterase [Bacteroidota bacterium]|nr:metallophosphoesterase [Bacteroidota bacterium]
MPLSIRVFIIGLLLLLVDWYFYQAIITVLKESSAFRKSASAYIYWGFTIFTFLLFLTPSFISLADWPKYIRVYLFALVIMVAVSKIIGSLFLATDDVIRLFRWIGSYFTTKTEIVVENSHSISRLKFLSQIALGMTALPLAGFIYGMVRGAFDYKIHPIKVTLPNLPSAFNGLKIIQISDIHSGSFVSTAHLEEAVKIIEREKPDLIFFTGDLVNDRASETDLYIEVLSKIKAPLGVFSTLGNHDYGDYVTWGSPEAKAENLNNLKNVHAQVGWKLLMNEHIPIKIGEDEIAIIGIENWGGSFHFPKYGDLKKAHSGTEKYPVKLLLSHDPSHWDLQVKEDYKDIDITFSGHTHGGQFGIEIPGFRWSPSQYAYKQWAGLYSHQDQHLYVNRGLGFLGYPGRVGISPEITVMELYNS